MTTYVNLCGILSIAANRRFNYQFAFCPFFSSNLFFCYLFFAQRSPFFGISYYFINNNNSNHIIIIILVKVRYLTYSCFILLVFSTCLWVTQFAFRLLLFLLFYYYYYYYYYKRNFKLHCIVIVVIIIIVIIILKQGAFSQKVVFRKRPYEKEWVLIIGHISLPKRRATAWMYCE